MMNLILIMCKFDEECNIVCTLYNDALKWTTQMNAFDYSMPIYYNKSYMKSGISQTDKFLNSIYSSTVIGNANQSKYVQQIFACPNWKKTCFNIHIIINLN